VAFILSLGLHAALIIYFNTARVGGFVFTEKALTVTKPFNMKRVALPALPEEKVAPAPDVKPVDLTNLTIPAEKPVLEEVYLAPQLTKLQDQVLPEKPRMDTNAERLKRAEASAREAMDKQLNSNLGDLLKEAPRLPRQPRVAVGSGKGSGAGTGAVDIPGLGSLDDLVSRTGSFKNGEKAAMSGGALFAYDSATLVTEAISSLQKLGTLIQQNPKITFSIEGHSDSFGSPEYNLRLSVRRAEAVKAWLVQNMAIPPDRIQTRGLGDTKLIVSAEHSQEEQAPNRRVEIVLKTNRR
jgi:outer membrane protein OmpA-like peptidoglycan-associated protein